MRFKPYDPTWLADLARQQRPDLSWLPESLTRCRQCHKKLRGRKKKCIYIYFVDSSTAGELGAEWRYRETISLDHPVFGHIKLNVLHGDRVGGVEFYDRLFSSGKPKPPTSVD